VADAWAATAAPDRARGLPCEHLGDGLRRGLQLVVGDLHLAVAIGAHRPAVLSDAERRLRIGVDEQKLAPLAVG
jgi:hypothetical protein